MIKRLFNHFPKDGTRCPVCGTSDDKPCFLLPIDGTERDSLCEGIPAHADCIRRRLDKFRYNREMGAVYMLVEKA